MRKFFLSLAAVTAMVTTAALAENMRVVKYDPDTKTLTVKGAKKGDTEETKHVLTDKVKFMQGDKEVPADKAMKMMAGEKAPKMVDLTLNKDGKLEAVKFMGGKGKKKKDDNK